MKRFLTLLLLVGSVPCLSEVSAVEAPASKRHLYVTTGPGVAYWAGEWGAALFLGVGTEIVPDVPLVAGLDVVATVWNFRGTRRDGYFRLTFMGLHLLPTLVYRFSLNSWLAAHLGVSAGPHVLLGNADIDVPEENLSLKGAGVGITWEYLLRPALHFALTPRHFVTVEPRVGVLEGALVFFPQASLSLTL